jgi:hypothetical protein
LGCARAGFFEKNFVDARGDICFAGAMGRASAGNISCGSPVAARAASAPDEGKVNHDEEKRRHER